MTATQTPIVIIKTIVSQLFNNDIENIPEEQLKQIEPISFSKEVIKQKLKNGYHSKIKIPANYLIEKVEIILEKINEARLKLNGEKFEELWKCFEFSLDISVWGSDTWAPRLLPNGSLLIRNHHRVIALSEQIQGTLNINNHDLQSQLKDIEIYSQETLSDDDSTSFNIIHRSQSGVSWIKEVPEELSDFGQTLVFIDKSFIETARENGSFNKDNIIFNDLILNIAENSRSGHCVMRVFKEKTFLYSTFRAGDDYDTILENYSSYLGTEPGEEECTDNFQSDTDFINKYILECISNNEVEIFSTKPLKQNEIMNLLVDRKIKNDYVTKKTWQIMEFTPFFASSWNQPTTYYGNQIDFWDVSEEHEHKLITVIGDYSTLPNISFGKSAFKTKIKKSISIVPKAKVLVWLPTSKRSNSSYKYINDEDIFQYDSKELNQRIDEVFKILLDEYRNNLTSETIIEDEKADQKEFLESVGYDYEFALLFITKTTPEPNEFNSFGLKISSVFEGSINIVVPVYGFKQGYCDGELDTGNAYHFLSEDNVGEEHNED
jgi:hypothetical protein